MTKADPTSDPSPNRLKDDVTVVVAKAIMAAPGTFMIGASIIMFLTSFLGLYVTFGREEDVEETVMKYVQLRVNDRWAEDLERRIQERRSLSLVFHVGAPWRRETRAGRAQAHRRCDRRASG